MRWIAIAAVVFLAGCQTYSQGDEFDVYAARSFEIGVTTQNDVRSRLGEPQSISYRNGVEAWTYAYSQLEMGMGEILSIYNPFGETQVDRGESAQAVFEFRDGTLADYEVITGNSASNFGISP